MARSPFLEMAEVSIYPWDYCPGWIRAHFSSLEFEAAPELGPGWVCPEVRAVRSPAEDASGRAACDPWAVLVTEDSAAGEAAIWTVCEELLDFGTPVYLLRANYCGQLRLVALVTDS